MTAALEELKAKSRELTQTRGKEKI